MITGKVYSTPKSAYLRCDGKGFNSSLGGLSSKGNTRSSIGGNGSNLGAHPFGSNTSLCSTMECRNSDSDVVTSSSQLGLTRQDMRGSSYETLYKYLCTTESTMFTSQTSSSSPISLIKLMIFKLTVMLPNDSVISPPLRCMMALAVAKNNWELSSLVHHRLSVKHDKIHRKIKLIHLHQYILHYPSRNLHTTVS